LKELLAKANGLVHYKSRIVGSVTRSNKKLLAATVADSV